jgi:hypothetical protein
MRLLPEGERRDTLALLEQNRAEVERQLAALPIIIETPSQVCVCGAGGGGGWWGGGRRQGRKLGVGVYWVGTGGQAAGGRRPGGGVEGPG